MRLQAITLGERQASVSKSEYFLKEIQTDMKMLYQFYCHTNDLPKKDELTYRPTIVFLCTP